jgi:hypothetical protein
VDVGLTVGSSVGVALGAKLGLSEVGGRVEGTSVGVAVGSALGTCVGVAVATLGCTVGSALGSSVGASVGVDVGLAVGSSVGVALGAKLGLLVVGGRVEGTSVGVRVGLALGTCVGMAVGSFVAAALHTALVMEPMDFASDEKPEVTAIKLSAVGELTHGVTVEARMFWPIVRTITLMPSFLAAKNSRVGASLGLPSVIMSRIFGTPARPLRSTLTAFLTAGAMYVPPR